LSAFESQRSLDRRTWLGAMAGGFGLALVGLSLGVGGVSSEERNLQKWLRRIAAGSPEHSAALGRLGASYLVSHPTERNTQLLSSLVMGEHTGPVRLSLTIGVARDWAEHNVTVVDGWVLSRAEARICAVLHLMGGT
jgi:hypothetical protein